MDDQSSLRQTVTHLFDAVRYGRHARELEEAARAAEANLEEGLNKIESQTDELGMLLTSMKDDPEPVARDLSRQVEEFLSVAKEQARAKLEKKAKDEIEQDRNTAIGERDKTVKSLEAYLAANPLPIIDSSVTVHLVEGLYIAQASYECEGGMKYEFGLAAHNSRFFHQELTLSQLGHELRVPVRFSRTILKGRVPGFERLDQYLLADAELSNGKIRANFQKTGNGAKIKVVMSGFDKQDFVGLEYRDQMEAVNVMNDLSLQAHVDLETLKSAMRQLANEMAELADKKVTILRLSLEGEDLLKSLDCYGILQVVIKVLGPEYKSLLEQMPERNPQGKSNEELSLAFVRERLRVLGELSNPVSQLLGIQDRGLL